MYFQAWIILAGYTLHLNPRDNMTERSIRQCLAQE